MLDVYLLILNDSDRLRRGDGDDNTSLSNYDCYNNMLSVVIRRIGIFSLLSTSTMAYISFKVNEKSPI